MKVFQATLQDMLTLQGLVSLPCRLFLGLCHTFFKFLRPKESLGWDEGMDIFSTTQSNKHLNSS